MDFLEEIDNCKNSQSTQNSYLNIYNKFNYGNYNYSQSSNYLNYPNKINTLSMNLDKSQLSVNGNNINSQLSNYSLNNNSYNITDNQTFNNNNICHTNEVENTQDIDSYFNFKNSKVLTNNICHTKNIKEDNYSSLDDSTLVSKNVSKQISNTINNSKVKETDFNNNSGKITDIDILNFNKLDKESNLMDKASNSKKYNKINYLYNISKNNNNTIINNNNSESSQKNTNTSININNDCKLLNCNFNSTKLAKNSKNLKDQNSDCLINEEKYKKLELKDDHKNKYNTVINNLYLECSNFVSESDELSNYINNQSTILNNKIKEKTDTFVNRLDHNNLLCNYIIYEEAKKIEKKNIDIIEMECKIDNLLNQIFSTIKEAKRIN